MGKQVCVWVSNQYKVQNQLYLETGCIFNPSAAKYVFSISSLPNILSILKPVPQNILLFVSMHSRALLKQLTRPHGMYATFCIDSLVLFANGNDFIFFHPDILLPLGKQTKSLAATEDFSK